MSKQEACRLGVHSELILRKTEASAIEETALEAFRAAKSAAKEVYMMAKVALEQAVRNRMEAEYNLTLFELGVRK